MAKQIYIDSNGNEVQVSGTVNSADLLPLAAGSDTSTAEAIEELSTVIVDTLPMGSYSSSGSTLTKCGKLIILNLSSFTNLPAGGFTELPTIPEEYRPVRSFYVNVIDLNMNKLRFYITTAGRFAVYNYGSQITATNSMQSQIVWFTA